jgi:hypothetical protein
VQFKGMANSNPARQSSSESKKAIQITWLFEYTLTSPNQWANVTLEIQGHPTKDGQTTADDVSGDKDSVISAVCGQCRVRASGVH